MGIILAPILLYSVYIFITSLTTIVGLVKQKSLYFSEVSLGLLLSIIILGVFVFKYYKAGSAMFVEICLEVPLCAIILPYFIYQMMNKQSSLSFFSNTILVSIIFTSLLSLFLQSLLSYLKIM
ncbi:MAG: hypothetical protein EAZ85_03890 [Bacteroidetes bacterium]|nr:MAG: hypothetical protein EAZ85_03890 [Bacteroidota bacterium]